MDKKINLLSSKINSDEPWNDDKLNRRQVADTLTNLITGKEQPLVVSLSGGWGTGKTFMLQRWQKDLEKGGYVSIYFNAWEDDFCNDPFVAIIGQITEEIQPLEEYSGVLGNVEEAAQEFIDYFLFKVMDKVTGGWVEKGLIDSMKNKVLSEYKNQRQAKEKLKKCLEKMSAEVKAKSGNPLVFIVDELDRCRPTFAIELLERIKHVFDVPNMVFVVGINREQLCKSINSVYGEIDANTYLQRFFDVPLTMPEVSARDYVIKYVWEHYFGNSEDMNLNVFKDTKHGDEFSSFLERIAETGKLPLRDLEHYIRHLYLIANKEFDNISLLLLFVVIMVKMKNPELYKKWAASQLLGAEVMNFVDEILDRNNTNSRHCDEVILLIETALFSSNFFQHEKHRAIEIMINFELDNNLKYFSQKTRDSASLRNSNMSNYPSPLPEEPNAYTIRVKSMRSILEKDGYSLYCREHFERLFKLVEILG